MRGEWRELRSMLSFEISIVSTSDDTVSVTLSVEASNWVEGLRAALAELSLPWDTLEWSCDIEPDGLIRVTDAKNAQRYEVRPLSDQGHEPHARYHPNAYQSDTSDSVLESESDGGFISDLLEHRVDVTTPGPPQVAHVTAKSLRELPKSPPSMKRSDKSGDRGARLSIMRDVWDTISHIESHNLTAEQLFDTALELSYGLVPCEMAQIILPVSGTTNARVVAALGAKRLQARGCRIDLHEVVSALKTRDRTERVEHIDLTIMFKGRTSTWSFDLTSLLWAPIGYRGRELAVLVLFNLHSAKEYEDVELRGLEQLTDVLGGRLSQYL